MSISPYALKGGKTLLGRFGQPVNKILPYFREIVQTFFCHRLLDHFPHLLSGSALVMSRIVFKVSRIDFIFRDSFSTRFYRNDLEKDIMHGFHSVEWRTLEKLFSLFLFCCVHYRLLHRKRLSNLGRIYKAILIIEKKAFGQGRTGINKYPESCNGDKARIVVRKQSWVVIGRSFSPFCSSRPSASPAPCRRGSRTP